MTTTHEVPMSFADRVRWAIILLPMLGLRLTIADVAPEGADR